MEKLCSLKVSLLIGSLLIVLTELSESSCQKPECILERQSEQLFQQHRLLLWALCIWYRLIHLAELPCCSGIRDESTSAARVVLRSLQWHLAGSEAVLLMLQQAIFRNTAGIFPE